MNISKEVMWSRVNRDLFVFKTRQVNLTQIKDPAELENEYVR